MFFLIEYFKIFKKVFMLFRLEEDYFFNDFYWSIFKVIGVVSLFLSLRRGLDWF